MISETLYPKVFISSQKSGYDLETTFAAILLALLMLMGRKPLPFYDHYM
jgi:hypothetical protein